MYNPWRRTTGHHCSTEGVELLQPYGYREERPSSGESNRRITGDADPFSVKLLHSRKATIKVSEDRDSRTALPRRNIYDRLLASSVLPSGWRAGALASLIGTLFVLVLNLAITIWVGTNPSFEVNSAVGTMYRGNCAIVRKRNIWIHLLVNVLSTLLLCGSNYVMQVLASPNRGDIDRAHAQRRWLHIGVPNLRNLRYIRRDRVVIYIMLFLSSVPLHLLFNSVVFTRLQANAYFALPTTADWIEGSKYNYDNFIDFQNDRVGIFVQDFEKYRINLTDTITTNNGSVVPRYQNLSTEECFKAYDSHYVSDFGNVYLVQSEPVVWRNPAKWELRYFNSSGFEWARSSINSTTYDRSNDTYQLQEFNYSLPFQSTPRKYPSNMWRCQSHIVGGCDSDNPYEISRDRSQWSPYGSDVRYCLAERVEEFCELSFSFAIAIVVIIANLVKASCIAFTLFRCKDHAALVTIGDAIASFLDNPDPTTVGRCLQTRRHVELWWNWNEWAISNRDIASKRDRNRFRSRRRRWAMAPSEARWVATYWSYGALVIAGIALTVAAMKNMPKDPKKLWATGFGAIQGNNLLKFETSLLGGVLLANTPQALLSYMYLAFNALYTTMFVSAEWASYSVERKPLRVTQPVGQQRSTYWLGVPFRYAIPVTIVSGLFHWLASQSLFKVQISVTDMRTRKVIDQISTCGYSPVAIILTMVVAAVLAGGGIGISAIRYPTGIPLVASNSAAISAGCHPLPGDSDASVQPVQWGADHHGNETRASGYEPVGHCCFSSFPVEVPIEGHLYE